MTENSDELALTLNSLHMCAEAHIMAGKQASIQIGEALYTKRLEVSQREFTSWIRGNLEFDTATANRYLEAFRKAESKKWQGFNL